MPDDTIIQAEVPGFGTYASYGWQYDILMQRFLPASAVELQALLTERAALRVHVVPVDYTDVREVSVLLLILGEYEDLTAELPEFSDPTGAFAPGVNVARLIENIENERSRPIGYEAHCPKCGETFNPAGPDDLVHLSTLAGVECGGQGVLVGEWH